MKNKIILVLSLVIVLVSSCHKETTVPTNNIISDKQIEEAWIHDKCLNLRHDEYMPISPNQEYTITVKETGITYYVSERGDKDRAYIPLDWCDDDIEIFYNTEYEYPNGIYTAMVELSNCPANFTMCLYEP